MNRTVRLHIRLIAADTDAECGFDASRSLFQNFARLYPLLDQKTASLWKYTGREIFMCGDIILDPNISLNRLGIIDAMTIDVY